MTASISISCETTRSDTENALFLIERTFIHYTSIFRCMRLVDEQYIFFKLAAALQDDDFRMQCAGCRERHLTGIACTSFIAVADASYKGGLWPISDSRAAPGV